MKNWEEIAADGVRLARSKVATGWLVSDIEGPAAGRVTFFEDPEHSWDGSFHELS
jgi:hypothetical protein